MEREILTKLMEDAPVSHPNIPPEATDSIANEAAGAQRNNDKADPSKQEGMAGHQNASIKGVHGVQLAEKSVPTSNKRSLMERHPNASTYEVINSLCFYSHSEGYNLHATTYIYEAYQSHIPS